MIVEDTATIGQEAPEKDDVVIPLIGGDMNLEEIKANFNALLYMTTEQMAITLKLMELLQTKELVSPEELNDKVLSVTGNKEELTMVYSQLFSRFVGYYTSVRQILAQGQLVDVEKELEKQND